MNIDPRVFEKLGNFPKWQPGDGPAPYVFANRPAGHRAAWSCHWSSANGERVPQIVTPSDWGFEDPSQMTEAQIAAELQDNLFDLLVAAQPFGGAGMEGLFSVSLDLKIGLPSGANELIRSLLACFRQGYGRERTYVNPLNEPKGKVFRNNRRPGWG